MVRVSVGDGVRLAVQDINPRGRRTVLFVHGWPLSREIFECQYDVLPQYGIRCAALDLRGFGDSDQPFSGYSYDRLADDLHRVVCSLDSKCITLFGFSMGGAVCARYLSRYGNNGRVNRLVLCGAACPSFVQRPGYPYGMTTQQVDGLIGSAYGNRAQMCSDFAKMCFASDPGEPYLRWLEQVCMQSAGYADIQCAESLRDEDLRGDLARIKVPTAIFHGIQDRVCPYTFAEEMRKGISNSYVVPFDHSGHFLFWEEKDKCNSNLIDFINTP